METLEIKNKNKKMKRKKKLQYPRNKHESRESNEALIAVCLDSVTQLSRLNKLIFLEYGNAGTL